MHNFLWAKGVHRRDISFGGLMYRKNANGEFLCGVLNDWDLGKLDGKGKQSLFRTGTRAFLATDLLLGGDAVHFERHDWESNFYVLVWITARYENKKEVKTDDLLDWTDFGDIPSRNAKLAYLHDFDARPRLRPMYEALNKHWIIPLAMLLMKGLDERSTCRTLGLSQESTEDAESLFGYVTYEKLWAILKKDLPEPST